ncbi:MAG: ATP-binding protein [Methanocorpusculum sp.]|nr:ATP-binding protein [Methanocorpusculum sp.]
MDAVLNPFSPGAGSPPPELIGRSEVLEEARVLIGRLKAGRSVQSLLLNGLRGVGKTVVLNEIRDMSRKQGILPIKIEINEDESLAEQLVPLLKDTFFDLDRLAKAKDKIKKGIVALRNFMGTLKLRYGDFGIDIEPIPGLADSGSLQHDLIALFRCVGEAAAEQSNAVLLLIDEIQCLPGKDLRALIMMAHEMQQERLPVAIVGAGLPILPGLVGNVKTYAERLFLFPTVDALSEEDAKRAIGVPLSAGGVAIDDRALRLVAQESRGYPYFIQEWGYQLWNRAAGKPIQSKDVSALAEKVEARLDANFFRVRIERLTPGERDFLKNMGKVGGPNVRMGELAKAMRVKVTALGPRRTSLIRKGMIYSPAYGEIAFTVPMFAEFLRRNPRI